MANKKFLLGILVLALVFGMTVIGCEDEEKKDEGTPYPQSIEISVTDAIWWPVSKITGLAAGDVAIYFKQPLVQGTTYTGTPISVDDLNWLQASNINLELSNEDIRTVTITSIEKNYVGGQVNVSLELTRSAEPSGTESTATVFFSLPNDFTAKYPDITWGKKTFKY
jgi:hypothetical protein